MDSHLIYILIESSIEASCVIYTFLSIPYIYFISGKLDLQKSTIAMGIIAGVLVGYLVNFDGEQSTRLYGIIVSPIIVSYFVFGKRALILGCLTAILLTVGHSLSFSVFSFIFFTIMIVLSFFRQIRFSYLIIAMLMAQLINLYVNYNVILLKVTPTELTTRMTLSFLSLFFLHVTFNFLFSLSGRVNLLQHQSETDALTQFINKRGIDINLKLIEISKTHCCIAFLDVDFFKKVNDTYGHPSGDIVLSNIAKIIKGNIRSNDFAGRYGGEEFLVILYNDNLNKSKEVLDQIRIMIEGNTFYSTDSRPIKLTLSGGVAKYNPSGDKSINTVLQYADKALYTAKSQGRNNVVLYQDE
ncbi:GGDEF domain-containing protein [Budvicia aquatica]|uniref:diguanylate cyclase n=1 Tax=Budvicia aquatica TaxID=82979 RepID=A0A2C6DK50_9GAMM|nr:GGDEF domain-containing protein [Budvicia aquatica]PHI28805.1 GGDEF domain-containing protein [Budvicia aquatica]VFS46889.1 Diguanylate cyclase DosC [Budvicia aquatica]